MPKITDEHLTELRRAAAEHPEWHPYTLSLHMSVVVGVIYKPQQIRKALSDL